VLTHPGALASLRGRLALALNRRFFFGWLMLAVGALGYFASGPAQSHIFSVYISAIGDDLGISRTSISSAYAAATLAAAFGLPYMGRLVDRFGVRRVMTGVILAFALAQAVFGQVQNIAALAITFAALRFFGQGSLMLSCANLVSQWFSRKRGFALSLMSLGFALSMAAHPPLSQWLMDSVGWRQSWLWLALSTLLLMLPLLVLLVHDRP
jgi:MFS family permease